MATLQKRIRISTAFSFPLLSTMLQLASLYISAKIIYVNVINTDSFFFFFNKVIWNHFSLLSKIDH